LVRLFTFSFLLTFPCFSQSAGVDLLLVEEGDDRIRPGLSLVAKHYDYKSELTLYGRKFGPVTERTFILSVSKYIDIFRFGTLNQFMGSGGLAIMDETISIDLPSESKTEHSGNLGIVLGVHQKYHITDKFSMNINWQSFVFPAGFGGIFLSTGRKQTIGVGFELSL
jgi:hypothetical protein